MDLIESPWSALLNDLSDHQLIPLRQVAVNKGLIAPDWNFLVNPIQFSHIEFNRLVQRLAILENLVFDLPNRLFSGNYSAFYRAVGLNQDQAEFLLSVPEAQVRPPLRWDLMPTPNGWKVLEINAGACLGGFLGAEVFSDYLELGSQLGYLPKDIFVNSFEPYSRQIAQFAGLGVNEEIFVTETEAYFEKYGFHLQGMVRGLNAVGLSAQKIRSDRITNAHKHILPMFTLEELLSEENSHGHLISLLRRGEIKTLMPFSELAYSSKAVFAMLTHAGNAGCFSREENEVIGELVPSTFILTEGNFSNFNTDWVLKPFVGYGGQNVECGWHFSKDAFRELLNLRAKQGGFLLQQRVEANAIPCLQIDAFNHIRRGLGRPVMGLITVASVPVGGIGRVILNEDFPGATNAHRGAALGLATIPNGVIAEVRT